MSGHFGPTTGTIDRMPGYKWSAIICIHKIWTEDARKFTFFVRRVRWILTWGSSLGPSLGSRLSKVHVRDFLTLGCFS